MRAALWSRGAALRLFPYAAAATCGFLAIAPLVLTPGIPAYQHDWSWPFSVQAAKSGIIGHLSLWEQGGLGRPNALASANPLLLILSGSSWFLGPIVAAKIAIAGAAILAALSATFCARRTIANGHLGPALAGILYATSPVIFNKFAAGQVTFWYAYALLPLIFERARAAGRGDRSAMISTALLCALTTIQPQFAVFSLIALISAAFPFENPRRAAQLFVMAVGGIAVALLPTAWALFSSRADILAQYPWPVQTWERMHSASPGLALLTSHYIIPYYESALRGNLQFAQAAAAAGLLGILLTVRRRDGQALLILLIAGLLFTTGTAGPLRALWSWMFAHVEPAAFFRELYNANALISLAYALGAAAACRALLIGRVAAAALVAFSAVPIVLGSLGFVVHNVVDDDPSFAAAIGAMPPGRILYLPSLTPLVRNGREPGGVDVLAVGDRMHPSSSEYPPQFPLTTMSVSGNPRDAWWQHLVDKMGVVAIIGRPNLRSEEDLGSAGTRAATTWIFASWAGRPLAELAARATSQKTSYRIDDHEAVQLTDQHGLLPETPGKPEVIVPQASLQTDDPSKDWAPLDRWRASAPDPATSLGAGVVTSSRAPLTIRVPRGSWSVLAQATPSLIIIDGGAARRIVARSATWIPLHASGTTVTISSDGGRAAVYRVASGAGNVPLGPFAAGQLGDALRKWPWEASLRVRRLDRGAALLVFRDRYSSQWRIEGARTLWHGIADGYANAFVLSDVEPVLHVVYAPQARFFMLAALSSLAYLIALLAIVRFQRARAPR